MKTKSSYFLTIFFISVFFVSACCIEEIGPDVQLTDDAIIDTTFIAAVETPDDKVVLIEEFTGLACPNCPAGTNVIEQIMADNPGRVIPIAYVEGALAEHADQNENYITTDGDAVAAFLGGTSQWPSGGVDRDSFTSQIITGYGQWNTRVDTRLLETSPVNIDITFTLMTADTLKILVDLRLTEVVVEEMKVSIGITESHIIDVQDSVGFDIPDYEHNHIFRDMVTSSNGETLVAPNGVYEAGRVFQKAFKTKLGDTWTYENLTVIAFVHSATLKEVIQAAEIEVD